MCVVSSTFHKMPNICFNSHKTSNNTLTGSHGIHVIFTEHPSVLVPFLGGRDTEVNLLWSKLLIGLQSRE